MEIKRVTKTLYEVNGREYQTQADAEMAVREHALERFLHEHGGAEYDFDVERVVEAMFRDKTHLIALLGGPDS